jgi:hypothetical protein
MSNDEAMKAYKISFQGTSGRQMLDPMRQLALFGGLYAAHFRDDLHESCTTPAELGLGALNEAPHGCPGVIGYGIQSSLLYGVYPRCFAHRSQNAVWSLYFLSGRKEFGLRDGSEFLMVHADLGTCEQNYFYPAELFGFYALRIYLLLKVACQDLGISLLNSERYIYLSRFCDHVADSHRGDINVFKWSSDHVESQPWF